MHNLSRPLLLFLLLLPLCRYRQEDRPNYALLWEISGNGLEQPSYLFGSIHVFDEHAFEFSDSVLFQFDACEAFAMEFHPDSLSTWLLESLEEEAKPSNLREQMIPEGFARLDSIVRARKGIPLDSLDIHDPFWIDKLNYSFAEPEYTVKREQVLDLYLFSQARKQGKRTYGLESREDYQRLSNSFIRSFDQGQLDFPAGPPSPEEEQESFEQLMAYYQAGELDSLGYFDEFWQLDVLHIILGELDYRRETGRYLRKMLALRNPSPLVNIIDALYMHGQPVEEAALDFVFETPYYWCELLRNLEYEGTLERLPRRLRSQKATARAVAFNLLEEEYGALSAFEWADATPYLDNDKAFRLHWFVFQLEDYEGAYLGVCSQPADEKALSIRPDIFDYHTEPVDLENLEATQELILKSWETGN